MEKRTEVVGFYVVYVLINVRLTLQNMRALESERGIP